METGEIIGAIVAIGIAVFGWAVTHWLSSKREIEQKKREIRVKYLRESYLKIAKLFDRGEYPRDIADLQDAFNDIQLFGEEQQVDLVGEIITGLTTGGDGDFNELLKQLRNEIRSHIGLQPLDSFRWYIRSHDQGEAADTEVAK